MKKLTLCLAFPLLLLSACSNPTSSSSVSVSASTSQTSDPVKKEFKFWNDCSALTKLKDFMVTITTKGDKFVPVEDRIAVFDMDGTLYGELFPTYLEYVMYEYRVLDDPSYKDKASEEQITFANEIRAGVHNNSYPSGTDMRHARLAAEAYAGMTLKEFDDYTTTFLAKAIPSFNNLTYGKAFYEPMREVVNYLRDNSFQVYVVSGSDRFLCRTLLKQGLGIPENRVIGMDVELKATGQGDTAGVSYTLTKDDQIFRSSNLLIKNLKFNKVAQINKEIGKQPILSFGNSGGDQAMHVFTITNNKYPSAGFQLVADDLTRDYSYLSDEKIASLNKQWTDVGLNVISMKNDFKTIYGEAVTKKVA